jgi:hypothetical protein
MWRRVFLQRETLIEVELTIQQKKQPYRAHERMSNSSQRKGKKAPPYVLVSTTYGATKML